MRSVEELAKEPETPPKRWTAEEFIELLNEGLIKDPQWVEVMDGLMVKEMRRGPTHGFIF